MKEHKPSKLVRISPIQHQWLSIMSAHKALSMMWLVNDLVNELWRRFQSEQHQSPSRSKRIEKQ